MQEAAQLFDVNDCTDEQMAQLVLVAARDWAAIGNFGAHMVGYYIAMELLEVEREDVLTALQLAYSVAYDDN